MGVEGIKKLREMTNLGISECKKAFQEAGGDFDKALKILKERGVQIKERVKNRKLKCGVVEAYVHFGGNLAAMVEVNCETDFVARTDTFKKLAKDLAMHIAATNPKYIDRESVPRQELEKVDEKEREDYLKEVCLLEQVFVKDNTLTVREYINSVISQTGENISVKRFARFSLQDD